MSRKKYEKKYDLEIAENRYSALPKAEHEYMWYRKAYYATVYSCYKDKVICSDRWYSTWAKLNNVTITKRQQKRISAAIDKIMKEENVSLNEAIALYAGRTAK